jgi:Arc/MetJ family transcription regulator
MCGLSWREREPENRDLYRESGRCLRLASERIDHPRHVYYSAFPYTLDNAMRTNIVIDDVLMNEALERTGLPTKKAAVEEGLRLLIKMANQKAVLDLAGAGWHGDLDAMREGRDWEYSGRGPDTDSEK